MPEFQPSSSTRPGPRDFADTPLRSILSIYSVVSICLLALLSTGTDLAFSFVILTSLPAEGLIPFCSVWRIRPPSITSSSVNPDFCRCYFCFYIPSPLPVFSLDPGRRLPVVMLPSSLRGTLLLDARDTMAPDAPSPMRILSVSICRSLVFRTPVRAFLSGSC